MEPDELMNEATEKLRKVYYLALDIGNHHGALEACRQLAEISSTLYYRSINNNPFNSPAPCPVNPVSDNPGVTT